MRTQIEFAAVILVILSWMYVTVPRYDEHEWECGTDDECLIEEFEIFGTVDGMNPAYYPDQERFNNLGYETGE